MLSPHPRVVLYVICCFVSSLQNKHESVTRKANKKVGSYSKHQIHICEFETTHFNYPPPQQQGQEDCFQLNLFPTQRDVEIKHHAPN
jgi:hypothetical protein